MRSIFVDASALVSAKNNKDALHQEALEIIEHLDQLGAIPYTSTGILAEALNVISKQLGKKEAVSVLDEIRSGKYVVITPDEDLIQKTEDIFRATRSKTVSYTDCSSFVIMKEFDIKWAFSFDLHFKKFGFKRLGVDGWPK